jgi:hypothetical protein
MEEWVVRRISNSHIVKAFEKTPHRSVFTI